MSTTMGCPVLRTWLLSVLSIGYVDAISSSLPTPTATSTTSRSWSASGCTTVTTSAADISLTMLPIVAKTASGEPVRICRVVSVDAWSHL